MSQNEQKQPVEGTEGAISSLIPHPSSAAPWEQIENGRYRPRRIRGSCIGRELG